MARLHLEIDSYAPGASRLAFSMLGLGLACLLAPAGAAAGQYSARVRFAPSTSTGVVEYEVYRRQAMRGYGTAEPGVPSSSGGVLSLTVGNMDVRTDYVFRVKAVAASGASALSNEVRIGYLDVAALLDSDRDGLTEALEDTNLNRLVDAGESDPDRADSDGDGVGDLTDTCEGTAAGSAVSTAGCSCAQVSCDNGNACDGMETCTSGVCRGGTVPVCNDGNPCTSDSCVPATGCRHQFITGCSSCTSASQCNDANPCTTDACTAGRCQSTAVANGIACGDGNACNGAETCQTGACRAGTAPNCNDANPCTSDSCSAASGCQHAPIAGCSSCTTATQCNDGNVCTTDSCVAGSCRRVAVTNGSPCPDSNVCNGAETCHAGTCRAGTALTCVSDGNACTIESCNPTTGCGSRAAADGTSCGDGNACNGGETCRGGACTAGTPPACDDANSCTTDTCDPARGCVGVPVSDDTPCGVDRGFCAGTNLCRAGVCVLGNPPTCDDSNACTTDTCDDALGRCTHDGRAACCRTDADCADSDACTTQERCHGRKCVSTPLVCPDPGSCAASRCDPARGCLTVPLVDDAACDAGNRQARACMPPAADALEPLMSVERFATRRLRGHKQRLRGRVTLPGGRGMELETAGVSLQIDDAVGAVLYRVDLTSIAFEAKSGGDRMRVALEKSPDAKLRRLKLAADGDDLRVLFTIVGDGIVPADATAITLKVEGGGGCLREAALTCRPGRGRGVACTSRDTDDPVIK